jgi:hypothetical protein
MQKIILGLASFIALGVGGYMLYAQNNASSMPEPVACTMEAKLCPDGVTSVGRQGPNCEFAACPAPAATTTQNTATVTLKLGERKEVLGIFITPVSIVEDSRCAADVQCIWAGTVKVKMKVESGMGIGDLTLEQGALGTTETEEIILTEVSPYPQHGSTKILDADYRLTFKLTKRS